MKPLRVLVTPAEFFALLVAAQLFYDGCWLLVLGVSDWWENRRRARRPWMG